MSRDHDGGCTVIAGGDFLRVLALPPPSPSSPDVVCQELMTVKAVSKITVSLTQRPFSSFRSLSRRMNIE
jgi:hypothetical protein